MKYDDNHIRNFEGAKGKCNNCGLEVELDWQDKTTHFLDYWLVRCPHCGTEIKCEHEEREKKVGKKCHA